jgi:predicted SnoaL-like aldol condensation-catalyzing enzyme
MSEPKDIAVAFLELVIEGRIDEAYERYVDPDGTHHNVHTPAGFEALREGMKENEERFPDKELTVKLAIGDGEMVAVHSHLVMTPGDTGMAVVHMFRIADGKIAELWDCGQAIPEDSPNTDGPF